MTRLAIAMAAIILAASLIVGCSAASDPTQDPQSTPTPTIEPTANVESVVRQVLEEQRRQETPIPTPNPTPTVDVEKIVLDAAEKVLATIEARRTPSPTPTPSPPPTPTPTPSSPIPTASPSPSPTPTATASPTFSPPSSNMLPVDPRLRIAVPPLREQNTVPYALSQISEKLMPVYSHMIGRNITTNMEEPQLATSWEMESDGKTWHFQLREGVPFYRDAKPLNDYTFSAKDLFMMLDLQNGEALGDELNTRIARSPGRYRNYFGANENWVANSDYDVTLNLPNVNLDAAILLSDEWSTGIMSRDHWDDVGGEEGYKVDPVGNGPWSYVFHKIDDTFLHERVEDHWRITPAFHELEFSLIREPSTRLLMLLVDEVHIIPLIRTQREMINNAGFDTYRSTLPSIHQGFGFVYFRDQAFCSDDGSSFSPFSDAAGASPPPGLNHDCGPRDPVTQEAPIRDARVRHALNLAVNRNEINNVFFHGLGFPLVDYFPYWRDDFKDEWAPHKGPNGETGAAGGWPYPGDGDPERAKALLAEAGYPDGVEITLDCLLYHRVVPEWPDICEHIAGYWSNIGVTTTLDWSEDFGDFRVKTRDPSHNGGNWLWSSSPSLDPPCNAITYSMVWELGQAYREWEAASDLFFRCAEINSVEERVRATQDFAEAWLAGHYSVPLVWVFYEVAVNPSIVQKYEVNMLHFGPIRYHEHTVPVYQ